MAYIHDKTKQINTQVPPIVTELIAIFRELPDAELLADLRGGTRRGPKGYDPKVLWHCFVAYYALGLPSTSDLIRTLYNNPYIARACGMDYPYGIPSQPTLSRFFTKLSSGYFRARVKRVFYALTRRLYDTFPDFGKSVAMDATDIKAWSNGAHKKPTDKHAGWVVKADTNGRGKFTWGYKASILVDTTCELPLGVKVTSGNVHETKAASPLLRQARYIYGRFHPEYVIADSGYSSEKLRQLIRWQYHATPIVKVNPAHKRAIKNHPETPEWQLIYNRRTSVERVFSRLKGHRKLNYVRVRGIHKVTVHCLLSLIVMQAKALCPRQTTVRHRCLIKV
ncbi:transposase [Chloroflexota bacterium]